MSRTVIVGGSVGGVRTAQALRSEGYTGEIVLVEAESQLPYDKPPLSKALLLGTQTPEDVALLTAEQAAADDIELVLGARATGVRRTERLLEIAGREPIAYDHLVIATGAEARRGPWGVRPGIHVVRTLDDARELRADLDAGGPVVVIGAGFIGAEVAATARTLGLEVVLVDPLPTPMNRAMEPGIGDIVIGLHRRHGVDCRFGRSVATIEGERGAWIVTLDDGSSIRAGSVVVGIGAAPATRWLEDSGLTLQDGIVCDATLRSVDDPAIHAVGDIARWTEAGGTGTARAEHWTNAVDQAVCVAAAIAHPDTPPREYHLAEYVWTDQYDWKIQVVGRTTGAARGLAIGEDDGDRFAVGYGDADGGFVGAVVVNWPRALVTFRKALKHPSSLADVMAAVPGVTEVKEVSQW
ncbi:NAD(P)/FAD-dependent oxidoreductase [Raineyella sp. LH-20]|uniref:NAD(P)/FAD-dependent oxidoreductase n=1 Tax=Raineyella sp. LH-20 TaxID=3081204 RepID=UPI0029543A61|nr:FAD-dependent oxidoreductase [Raineyella sp. LH-20]WOP17423.1 FAD-dependent oxidoreductase [Raineyella sp. LH-20]